MIQMTFEEVKKKSDTFLFQNYGRLDVAFEYGKGMYLYGTDGKEYLDMVAGIAVNALGYAHPAWVSAMQEQITKLCHVSNLYYVKEQADAAEKVASVTPGDLNRVLFVNGGAEAPRCCPHSTDSTEGRLRHWVPPDRRSTRARSSP